MFPLAFGFGSPADIAIVLVLALIIFGPKKLPEIGKQIGQAMREMRKITDELTGTVHSVSSDIESAYKPVLSPPPEYGNPYSGTSSATVEKAALRKTYDQEPDDLMVPMVRSASGTEAAPVPEKATHAAEPAGPDGQDKKGH